MDLKIKDLAGLLRVSESEIISWIEDRKLPAYKIHDQYRFNRREIREWIERNKIPISNHVYELFDNRAPVYIHDLVKRGGIYYDIEGISMIEVIKQCAIRIDLPSDMNRDLVLYSLIDREEMMPTSIGSGIAIPHPRNPIIADIENESISINFLKNFLEYETFDKEPIHTVFIVLSANSRRHLEILAKLSFLCKQDDFFKMLKERNSTEEIMRFIQHFEEHL